MAVPCIFATARPSLVSCPVIPMDPAEQAVLDELRRRRLSRAASPITEARPSHTDPVEARTAKGNAI